MKRPVGRLTEIALYNHSYALYLPLVSQVIGGLRRSHFSRSEMFSYYRGEFCQLHLWVWGQAMSKKLIQDCSSFLFATRYSSLHVVCGGIIGAGRTRCELFALFSVQFGLCPCFPFVLSPLVWVLFCLQASIVAARFWQHKGAVLLEESYLEQALPVGFAMLRRISFVSCSFFLYSWALGHREASKRVQRRYT